MTLREFLTNIGRGEHYRIYNPNRDCLIFESFFTVHSPYYFDGKKEHLLKTKPEYFNNNHYCNDVYISDKMDKETKELLDRFGDYKVTGIEIGSFAPYDITTDETGNISIVPVTSKSKPNQDYLECFNIFISGISK